MFPCRKVFISVTHSAAASQTTIPIVHVILLSGSSQPFSFTNEQVLCDAYCDFMPCCNAALTFFFTCHSS